MCVYYMISIIISYVWKRPGPLNQPDPRLEGSEGQAGSKRATSANTPLLRLRSSEGKFAKSREIEPVLMSFCRHGVARLQKCTVWAWVRAGRAAMGPSYNSRRAASAVTPQPPGRTFVIVVIVLIAWIVGFAWGPLLGALCL